MKIIEIHDITNSLLTHLESAIDINFEVTSWDKIYPMLAATAKCFNDFIITDSQGNTYNSFPDNIEETILNNDCLHCNFINGTELFSSLQVFISRENSSPFIEITFFTEDINNTDNIKNNLLEWIESIYHQLHANSFFLRYENASWNFGDTNTTSGVIAFSKSCQT